MSKENITLTVGEQDFRFINNAEKNLESKGAPSNMENLPKEHPIATRPKEIIETSTKQVDILELMDLADTDLAGLVTAQDLEELLELYDDEPAITVAELQEISKPPESAEEAMQHYNKWLAKQNRTLEQRLESSNSPASKSLIVQSGAIKRTIQKNEYMNWVLENSPMTEQDKAEFTEEIQLLSALQLMVESDIMRDTKQQTMALKTDVKAGVIGALVLHGLELGDDEAEFITQMGSLLPHNMEYTKIINNTKEGVAGEIHAVKEMVTALETGFGDMQGIAVEIKKADESNDAFGVDFTVTARTQNGSSKTVLVDVKTTSRVEGVYVTTLATDGTATTRNGHQKVEPETYDIPYSLRRRLNEIHRLGVSNLADVEITGAISIRRTKQGNGMQDEDFRQLLSSSMTPLLV